MRETWSHHIEKDYHAERLEIGAIATPDRRHVGVVRPSHAGAFELLP
ncbi:MAG: hypothetical protein JOZ41_06160 [Chloroflexi bacterium]|nr:hypothetical protein [Chloroflexota bacterium]